jgi:uncharacterized protein YdaU (DUF1376 family)
MSGTKTWLPLYIGDYLAGTRRLNTTEHGAYLAIARELVWWPSFARLDPALRKVTAPLEAEKRHLEAAIAAAAAPPAPAAAREPSRKLPTEAEIAAVKAMARDFAAEMTRKEDADGRRAQEAKPRCLSRAQLITKYQRTATECGPSTAAARTRLNGIHRQRPASSHNNAGQWDGTAGCAANPPIVTHVTTGEPLGPVVAGGGESGSGERRDSGDCSGRAAARKKDVTV